MEFLNSKCDNCIKNVVCKYVDDMNTLINNINEELGSVSNTMPFSIKAVDCDYFERDVAHARERLAKNEFIR